MEETKNQVNSDQSESERLSLISRINLETFRFPYGKTLMTLREIVLQRNAYVNVQIQSNFKVQINNDEKEQTCTVQGGT